jgi:prolyl oligopeptidase
MQAAQAGEEPILIRVDTASGHGAGKPTAKKIEDDTDVLTFLAAVLPAT